MVLSNLWQEFWGMYPNPGMPRTPYFIGIHFSHPQKLFLVLTQNLQREGHNMACLFLDQYPIMSLRQIQRNDMQLVVV